MKPHRFVSAALLTVLIAPVALSAQALTSITSLRVAYSTRKVTAKATGELKAQLDSVDNAIAAASRAGNNGELRRQLSRGSLLLSGKPWADVDDYNSSLLLRTERVVVDSKKAYTVRLEQLYVPAIVLTRSLTANAKLVRRAADVAAMGTVAKDFGSFDAVSRDLRESPLQMDLDLRDVPDGRYNVVVQVTDSARALGSATLPIIVNGGIDARMERLESAAATAPAALRAEMLFPVDRMRHVNRGDLELRMFDIDRDIGTAEKLVAAAKAGSDPFLGRTGDMKRHYALDAAKEIMQYRVYVPTNYNAKQGAPLIVALHGLGQTEDSFFDAYGRKLPQLAEQFGYIVVAPLGYRVDGFYGWGVGNPPADAETRNREALSEADVMQVLAEARKLYNVDSNRIYLLGHSMGAIGAWNIAPKFPNIWAAMAVFSGQGTPASLALTKSIPEFVVHGDADATVSVRGSRTMVDAMKALRTEVTYIEVPGGSHSGVVEPNLPAAIAFFNAHKKGVMK